MNTKKRNEHETNQNGFSRRQALQRFAGGIIGVAAAPILTLTNAQAGVGGDPRSLIDRVISPTTQLSLVPEGDHFRIRSSGMPDHVTGQFPNPGCPGWILPVNRTYTIPSQPKVAAVVSPLNFRLFGLGVNGVSFDPSGPYYKQLGATGWHFEVMSSIARGFLGLDLNNAHTQPTGEYHYHGMPTGLIAKLTQLRTQRKLTANMILVGYAADGFPIYGPQGYTNPQDPQSPLTTVRSSYRMLTGLRPVSSSNDPGGHYDGSFCQDYVYVPGLGDLDECNGRVGVTPEYPQGIYHYYVTNDWPFIPRSYRGTVDASWFHPDASNTAVVPAGLMAIDFSQR